MNAILLAAGYGRRLRSITKKKPKCLVSIGKKKLLEIWIEKLIFLGVKKILINTHYLSKEVKRFISNSEHKKKIKIFHEKKLLGTGQTIYQNRKFLNKKNSLIIHADNFCLDDLKKLIDRHKNRPKKCSMTMMTFTCEEPKLCGIIEKNKLGIVNKMHEKSNFPKSKIANAAIYVVSKSFLKNLKKIKNLKDISKDIIPFFYEKIYTYHTKKPFFDIGTQKNLKKAREIAKL